MSDQNDSDKTEKPTPQKRRKAREEGQFARSRHAGAVASTVGVVLLLGFAGSAMYEQLESFAAWCFGHTVEVIESGQAYRRSTMLLLLLGAPPALAAAVFSSVIGFAQAGWHPKADLLRPKLERINPLPKLKSMVSGGEGPIEMLMSIARLVAVGVVAYATLRDAFPIVSQLAASGLDQAVSELMATASTLTLRATVALAVLAVLDYAQNRWRTERQLRMSRNELKQEMKQNEGDPMVKGRLRQRMREMSKHAVVAQVGASDVLVTNPTHVAVALRYRQDQPAPVVMARGYDEVALFMRQVAREAGVPIVENRLLARALAARAKPGQYVPADLYEAVAEVLAYVYRLRRRRVA